MWAASVRLNFVKHCGCFDVMASARIPDAAVVVVGDFNKDRRAHAAKLGFEPSIFARAIVWAI